MDDGNGCDTQPTHQTYPYHKDGSICPDWNTCDTMEHYSAQGLTELGVPAQPVKPQFEEIYPYHEDGSQCTHRDQLKCPLRMHYSEYGLSQLGIQLRKKFNHEGPADMDNVLDEMDELLEHEHTSQCRPPNVCPETSEEAMPIYAGPIGAEVPRDVSDTVDELIDGRVNVYGDPIECFTRHAQVWTGILGTEVQPWQVALCMLGYKLVRTGITPDYSDNSDDIEGYLDIFRQLMPDMVQARDTAEYLAGGGQGARA